MSSPTAPALLEAHELHSHYGESHVLRGVSLAIGREQRWRGWGTHASASPR